MDSIRFITSLGTLAALTATLTPACAFAEEGVALAKLPVVQASSLPETQQAHVQAGSLHHKPRRRLAVAVAAGFLFLIGGGVLLQQIIIRLTDEKGNTREIEVKPGEKIEIVQKPQAKGEPAAPAESMPEASVNGGWLMDQASLSAPVQQPSTVIVHP